MRESHKAGISLKNCCGSVKIQTNEELSKEWETFVAQ
jgi:hypothetical protein